MKRISWKYCQDNSNLILATGLSLLRSNLKLSFENNFINEYGNYLISNKSDKWNYIGEAKSLSKRITQHSKEKTSTFYKNYKKLDNQFYNLPKRLKLDDFIVRTIKTEIGRKEIEEFGIVNIPAVLNKFQKGKRNKYSGKIDIEVWNAVQDNFIHLLEQGEKEIMKSNQFDWFSAQIPFTAGLYWVEHKSYELIYIGESSNISERYETHSGKTYFSALRRHIGENILDFELQTVKGKKRYFSDNEDLKVTSFLRKCTIRPLKINFGRYELEEYLIRKHKPLLNRKENQ